MKNLLIILLSALSLTVFAQQKKMAVYVVDESPISAMLEDYAIRAFLASQKYILVERNELFLSTIAKEQMYQRSGRIDETMIAKLGQQYGIDCICLIRVYRLGASFCAVGKIVNATSASIYASSIGLFERLDDIYNLNIIDSWLNPLLSSPATNAADAAKVGIYVNGTGDPNIMNLLHDVAITKFMYDDNVNVIDRNSDFVEHLDKEVAYQYSGNVDDSMIIPIGKQYGLNAVFVANVTKNNNDSHIVARLVDVETSQIYAALQDDIITGLFEGHQVLYFIQKMIQQYDEYRKYKEWRAFCDLWQQSIAKAMEYPTLQDKDGMYKGGLLNHKRTDVDGFILEPSTKNVYFLSWTDNRPNGTGMMIITDDNPDRCVAKCPGARFYVGEWRNGKKHGKGKCYDALGRMIYNGGFQEGVPTERFPMNYGDIPKDSTFGFLIYNDSTFYLGELVDGRRDGLGVHVKDANIIYSTWKNNQVNGHAAYIPYKGYYASLLYENGTAVVDDLFVELGLPSGTKWAKTTDLSGFYTYEEILYHTLLFEKDEVPSLDHWWELKESCNWQCLDGGYQVTGPNGNSIFILGYDMIHYYSGVRKPKSKTAKYWSSTIIDKESAWAFECGKDGKSTMAITPIKTKLARHKILK